VTLEVKELYGRLCQRAQSYGITVTEAPLGKDKAGQFNGPSITINTDNKPEERAYFLAHSVGSIARWSLATEASGAIYGELRQAKKHKREEPERFERALEGFRAFEESTSEHAVWLLADLGCSHAVPPYTAFARADLDAMLEFHRTGTAPVWGEFFSRWKQEVARGEKTVRPYQPRPIPPFHPVKIETQEIVQEK
jgi:hypothetical protein